MPDIKNIGGTPPPVDSNVTKLSDDAMKLPNQQLPQNSPNDTSVGRGNVGQPVGLPEADPISQNALMPDVITGRDASQLIAADKLRSNAGHSATEVLLGLDRQPSVTGLLLAPPGNLESLRHLSPAMRRSILRKLLTKQRGQMRRLVAVMGDEEGNQGRNSDEENPYEENFDGQNDALPLLPSSSPATASNFYNKRAYHDLEATTKMLDLLDELLGMQDYTLSQMGTFAQG